ncbi:MAG TPA: sigma-70 family RNA polymerase sigma factor [Candidatus Goldiibacteriota bacterium]|nr:sigma-70 family RNA polymerase sigma factor [Candidatus Goldiibacteriota bacterium]HPI04354.1 sigma-70 family RNA polymerase sigma factor [Candidatus Goldiibacteriota bacterium]HPN65352.1 sigma-70 family RNA polymerase sigma factor [Candidatus Goldiibacteriota bacterium]HRQ44968.1 sigma-70 family RNA polymerase sigma factor [Candidatus Goldiibacteriota bacterium]
MSLENEKDIIEKAKKDPHAFAELFDYYFDKIFHYILYRTGNAETARDIAAEVFFKAQKNIKNFRFMGYPFSAWLYRMAGNEIISYFRHKKFEPLSLEAYLEDNKIEGPASRQDLSEEIIKAQELADSNGAYCAVKQALFKLDPLYQEVIVLKFLQEKSIKEICEILGKKEGTVKSLISRALEMIRKEDGVKSFTQIK